MPRSVLDTRDDAQHGRFAGAIDADEGYMFTFGDLEGDIGKNLLASKAFTELLNRKNCRSRGHRTYLRIRNNVPEFGAINRKVYKPRRGRLPSGKNVRTLWSFHQERRKGPRMLWPETTERNDAGELTIGGVSVVELAEQFGTPLYIFDEITLRNRARRAVASAMAGGPGSRAVFASKALELPVILALLASEGLGIDVVSGGELFVALASGIDPQVITFHGNNKSRQELQEAIDAGIE